VKVLEDSLWDIARTFNGGGKHSLPTIDENYRSSGIMRQSSINKPNVVLESVFKGPHTLLKRPSIGERSTPFDKQMAATTQGGSGFRYRSVTNNVLGSAASGTRNIGGSPDARVPLITPLAHSTTGSQRAAALLNLSVD
jgi:hypothetical protein